MKPEILENVFVTAIEGGSNYWYYITPRAKEAIRSAVPSHEVPYLSTALYKAVMERGASIEINDRENRDEVLGTLSKDVVEARLKKMEEDEGVKWAIEVENHESGDAESSDLIFQYIVMGEVTFG
jgi:hypothetical protein